MDGRRIGWVEGRGGVAYPGDSSKEDRMRKTRQKEKKEAIAAYPPFLSKASGTAAESCLALLLFSQVDI